MMKYKFLIIFFIVFLKSNLIFADNKNLEELQIISKNIRCLVCQGQSIYDSNSDFAINVKNLILKKIQNGSSHDEIYTLLKSKYGEWIVYKPEFNPYNYFLWLIPYMVFIILGGYIFIKIIKKNKKIN